jgi:NAD+ synthetase
VTKSGFSKVLLGLSGGIDSALVATIAADALGPKNVLCVRLPSDISSKESLKDADDLISRLGCPSETFSIEKTRLAIDETLSKFFEGFKPDVTEENIQSRIRGLLLMSISNKMGSMLLTTGNKSEVAVGYSTIYGDMAGGYNPIKDLYKTRVFKTCQWRNQNFEKWMKAPVGRVIPKRILEKPPSAELRLDQKDEDSLPPYDILDDILEGLIEHDLSVSELVKKGHLESMVKEIEKLIYSSEYKRYQSAPGVHLTERSFWLGRRYPIVQDWRDPS